MKVTLDIFSGRPNPTWTMRPEHENELARRLVSLPPAQQLPGGDDLGYRGFIITNQTGARGLPAEIRISNGLVAAKGAAGVSVFRDVSGLEQWLAEQAREEGLGSLLETIPGL
ncbi:MAG: hypothetical protein ACREHD_33545 [Pirellulales bacterium]